MDVTASTSTATTAASAEQQPGDESSNAAAKQAAIQAMMVQITTDGVPKLHCPVCNKALVSLNGYVKHVKKHEPPGGFMCRYCEAGFCSEEELKRHREAVHTTIACRICKELTFSSEQEYREHIRDVHNGIDRELYTCEKCGAEYKTVEPYRRHMDTECGTIKPHKCDLCPMSFVTKYNLKQHKESHTGERKFCCSYCGKDFLQKGRLVEHERSHTGEKPYKCDVCGKCFAHRESIVTHSSIHTGIRLVECKCCLSRFSCYSNLIKHRRTRPETCGLPEYDPPKNRVRTHKPRIPPTLNPTSEIKVSNMNKIIKPTDKEQLKKPNKKEATAEAKPKVTTRKHAGAASTRKTPAKRQRKKRASLTEDEEDNVAESSSDAEDPFGETEATTTTTTPPPKRQTRSSGLAQQNGTPLPSPAPVESPVVLKELPKTNWCETDSEEDYPDFDPVDSESDNEQKDYKTPIPKLPIKVEQPETPDEQAEVKLQLALHSPFEYSDTNQFNVKCEDDVNIFNEKDKLLNSLLNDNDEDNETGGPHELAEQEFRDMKPKAMRGKHFKREDSEEKQQEQQQQQQVESTEQLMLEETEVVLVKNENAVPLQEEDVLEVKDLTEDDLTNCKIMLEDVKLRYPKLKEKSSVKLPRNAKSSLALAKREQRAADPPPKRQYRKRGEANAKPTPRRMAKLSQHELKARLKLLKKEEKSWSCPYCIKIYHMRKPFEKHLRDDHKRPEEEIRDTFKTEDVGVINEDIFKCHICDKIYLVEKRLLAHVELHGGDGALTFKCPCYCNVYFATKDEATAHAQSQHRDLLFCECCQKFMTGHDSLKNHMRNHHTEKGPRNVQRNLVCDKCGKKFSGRTSLTDHVRSDCGRVPLYPCPICGKHLTTAGILKTHMLLHKEDTPYQCDKCGKTFKVKAQYKTHIKTRHTDFKPFKCHLCPKEYPYRESLLTHMTVHTGIKRFLCNGCGKRFTCISNLQAHRKVHADSCGLLPLNARATQYMGVQKGNLLLGAKPEAGLDYIETNTLIAKNVLDRDLPMAQELNFPSEPSAPLATVPLNYSQQHPPQQLLPNIMLPHLVENSHSPSYN